MEIEREEVLRGRVARQSVLKLSSLKFELIMFSSMIAEIKSLRTRHRQPHMDRSDEKYGEDIDSEGSIFNYENKENNGKEYSDSR